MNTYKSWNPDGRKVRDNMDIKEEIIKKLPSIYKQFIEYQMLDISKEMMEVAPTLQILKKLLDK